MQDGDDLAITLRAPLFAEAPRDVAEQLYTRSLIRAYGQGETIFLQGDKAEFVFVVLSGWAKLFRITEHGKEAVLGVFTRAQCFGESVAYSQGVYPFAGEAVSDCRLLLLRVATLMEVMRERPELFEAMLAAVSINTLGLITQIQALKAQSGAQRVAEFLLELCSSEWGAESITLPYDKTLIAGCLGLKPESLSRAFGRLRERGVTVEKNHAAIESIESLRDFVEADRGELWRGHQ